MKSLNKTINYFISDTTLPDNEIKYNIGWDSYLTNKLKKLLEDLINTPILKIPFWITQHQKELKKLGIKKNKSNEVPKEKI